MFSVSLIKGSVCLSYVFHITIRAGKLVNARVVEMVDIVGAILVTKKFSYGVLCSVGNTKVYVFEKFCDKASFFSSICKSGKFRRFC
jgi:hypothetical protein